MDSAVSLYSAAKMIVYVDKICAFYNVQFYNGKAVPLQA